MGWAGRHVVLGVSGGIACYKSCVLARRLTEAGARVDVALTHGAAEFVFDFIASFYPRATVNARVYLSAPQVPRLIESAALSLRQYQQRPAQQQQQPPAPPATQAPPET